MSRLQRRSGAVQAKFDGIHPLLSWVYANRGVMRASEIDYSLDRLLPPDGLREIAVAAQRLAQAIEAGESILVVGDYDADGATSAALALRGLRALGASEVDFLVPNRFEYGYGLTPELIAAASDHRASPDVLITVDNGIANHAGVLAAKQWGADVIVTDHHLPAKSLPDALAIVNPNQPGDAFASKALAGVGVMFYLLIELRRHLQQTRKESESLPTLAQFLDLVALGTVADVVPLDNNNRILVEQGLRRIRAGHCVPGITELLRLAGRDPANATAADLGFAVGPRLNAAGRLDDMSVGILCLLGEDSAEVIRHAATLHELNLQRREIETDIQQQAEAIVEQRRIMNQTSGKSQCLYDPEWHEGVIGIVASRIKDQLHKPVIVFADADNDTIKGSARSIPGLHIRDALQRVASLEPGLIIKYGGHAMAAGLSLLPEHLDRFERLFEQAVTELADPSIFDRVVKSDGELAGEYFDLESALALRAGGPWGQAFPEPLFDGRFIVRRNHRLKQGFLKLQLSPSVAQERVVSAIAFRSAPATDPPVGSELLLAYRLQVNEYQGRTSVQLLIEEFLDGED